MNVLFRETIPQPRTLSPPLPAGSHQIWLPHQREPILPSSIFPHWYDIRHIQPVPVSPSPGPFHSVAAAIRACAITTKRLVTTILEHTSVLFGWSVFRIMQGTLLLHLRSEHPVAGWIVGAYALFVVAWHVLPPATRVAKRVWRGVRRGGRR